MSGNHAITLVSLAGYGDCRWRVKMTQVFMARQVTISVDKTDPRFQAALAGNWCYRRLNKTAQKLVHELRDMPLIVRFCLNQTFLEVEVGSVHDWVEVEPFLVELLTRRFDLKHPQVNFNYHRLAS